jgi:hypothetical protein
LFVLSDAVVTTPWDQVSGWILAAVGLGTLNLFQIIGNAYFRWRLLNLLKGMDQKLLQLHKDAQVIKEDQQSKADKEIIGRNDL